MALEQHLASPAGSGAAETQLIPIQELSTGQPASIRNGAIKAVVAKAAVELKIAPDKLLVRAIRPKSDLDYTYETWYEVTGASSATFETMSAGGTGSKDKDRYIGIYGIQDESSSINCTLVRIKVGNSIKAIWNLQDLYNDNEGPRIGLSPSVVIIPPSITYTIERYVENTSSPAQIVLKGFIVERIGKTYSP